MFKRWSQQSLLAFCAATTVVIQASFASAEAPPLKATDLPSQAQAVLRQHCFDCHGKNPKRLRGDLNLFDRSHLEDASRKIVVAKAPDQSALISRVESDDDGLRMPPDPRPRLSDAERKTLRDWVAAGAAAAPEAAPAAVAAAKNVEDLAAPVKELFRGRCFECHGGTRTNAGVKILDHDLLVYKKKVVPGKPDESLLYQLVTAQDNSVMPPPGRPRLGPDDLDAVRRWIAEGAPAFPPDVAVAAEGHKDPAFKDFAGVDYVLKKILEDVRTLRTEDRRYVRYFSVNHILTAGATAAELDVQRDALAKAVNHLSWQNKAVRLRAIDAPANTVFALDLRDAGWQQQPFQQWKDGKDAGRDDFNLFDLALLEYPYAVVYEDSDTFDHLTEEFLVPAGQVRPVPFVRADWFVSVVTQPPLYEDFLQLPFDLGELETRLGIDNEADIKDRLVVRAGMEVSGVSRNNRVVERHSAKDGAYYWRSFDFRSSKGRENMFKDPIDLHPTGGEVIFSLPNGLQGYFVCNALGTRLEAAPTDIVTDKFAEDKTVRNGLSCMRCHDGGMKTFADTMRPALLGLPGSPGFDKRLALDLYPEQAKLDESLKEDGDRFLGAMQRILGKPQSQEPLIPASRRFLDDPVSLTGAAGELGLTDPSGLTAVFKAPQFSSLGLMPLSAHGVVRRDAWEDFYDQVVRGLGLGVPVVPIDGVLRTDYPAAAPPFEVELKTNKKNNSFEPGDGMVIYVLNHSSKPIQIELVGTSTRGRKVILTPSDTQVPAGKEYRYPAEGSLNIKPALGRELLTLLAGEEPFPAGQLLRGKGLTDRVVHPFYEFRKEKGRYVLAADPARLVKKTIAIETR